MDQLKNLLILLLHGLLVNANNFSFTGSNITNMTDPNGVNQDTVNGYQDFLNKLQFENPVLNPILAVFSNAFNNCYWCYPPYTCLKIGGEFISPQHPVSLPAYSPCVMNVKIELFTRRNPTNAIVFTPDNVDQIYNSTFNNDSDTKFTIDGYGTGNGLTFKLFVIQNLLERDNYNVFNVNWLYGSLGLYEQAEANGRLVGAIVGYFIRSMNKKTGHPLSKIHLIGSSLGAHICGYAGEYLSGQVARISGLDPAGPDYAQTDPRVRLSKGDARFVDVIHTNAGSLSKLAVGIDQQIGDMDFYPNGGSQQPQPSFFQLLKNIFTNAPIAIASLISHFRASLYFAESLKNSSCKFTSYACSNYTTFQMGSSGPCRTCGLHNESCAEMGINADQYAIAGHPLPAKYKFFLTTKASSPFCQN